MLNNTCNKVTALSKTCLTFKRRRLSWLRTKHRGCTHHQTDTLPPPFLHPPLPSPSPFRSGRRPRRDWGRDDGPGPVSWYLVCHLRERRETEKDVVTVEDTKTPFSGPFLGLVFLSLWPSIVKVPERLRELTLRSPFLVVEIHGATKYKNQKTSRTHINLRVSLEDLCVT